MTRKAKGIGPHHYGDFGTGKTFSALAGPKLVRIALGIWATKDREFRLWKRKTRGWIVQCQQCGEEVVFENWRTARAAVLLTLRLVEEELARKLDHPTTIEPGQEASTICRVPCPEKTWKGPRVRV